MGKSKDLATLKDSGLSIDGTLTTTSTGTNLTSNSYNVVKIQTDKDDNGSNDDAILQFTTGSSNTVKGELRYDESESMFEIGHGDNQGHIRIDTSGRVTMPSQIGFSYCGSKSYVIAATGTQVMTSSNVWSSNVNHSHNRGSHFNASTGRFTCPIAGRYLFMFNCQMSDFGSGYLYSYMRLNQSVFSYTQKSQQNTWTAHVHTAIMELNANDYVDVAWTNNYVSGQIHYPEFTGQLIG